MHLDRLPDVERIVFHRFPAGRASVDVYANPGFTYSYSYDRRFDADSSVKGITLTTLPN